MAARIRNKRVATGHGHHDGAANMPATGAEANVTETRGSALTSVAGLLLAFGAAMLAHQWHLLPAPQHLLPLLPVYIGARGARHTVGGARLVSLGILAAGLIAQAAVLHGLPGEELHLLRPLGSVLRGFGAAFGVLTHFSALAILAAGGVLLLHSRRKQAASAPDSTPHDAAPPSGATSSATGATRATRAAGAAGAAGGDTVDQFVLFSGASRSVSSSAFRGGRLVALFGGIELDLRQAALARPEARLDVFNAFGGTTITVPEGCEVIVQAVPIFGAVEVKGQRRPKALADGAPPAGGRLIVGGLALFGGIEIAT